MNWLALLVVAKTPSPILAVYCVRNGDRQADAEYECTMPKK